MISQNLATIINMLECQGNGKKREKKKKIMKEKKVKKNERKRKRKKQRKKAFIFVVANIEGLHLMCENGMYFGLIICIVCMFLNIYFSTISFSLLPSLKPQKKSPFGSTHVIVISSGELRTITSLWQSMVLVDLSENTLHES